MTLEFQTTWEQIESLETILPPPWSEGYDIDNVRSIKPSLGKLFTRNDNSGLISSIKDFAQVTKVSRTEKKVEMVLPSDIRFDQLQSLVGKRTKVTIEILPW